MKVIMASTKSGIENDLKQFKQLDSNRKMLLVALIGGLFLVSLYVGNKIAKPQMSDNTPTSEEATTETVEQLPSTKLELSPANLQLATGQTQRVSVNLSDLAVTALDVVLVYDPAAITVSDIKNGTTFERVIQSKTNAGQLLYSAAINPDQKDNLQAGEVFSFAVTAKKATNSSISFDPLKTKTALNGENTLGTTNEISITVTK